MHSSNSKKTGIRRLRLPWWIAAACFVATALAGDSPGRVAVQPKSSDYHIGSGDVLEVSVWKEPDASVSSVVVRYDGEDLVTVHTGR